MESKEDLLNRLKQIYEPRVSDKEFIELLLKLNALPIDPADSRDDRLGFLLGVYGDHIDARDHFDRLYGIGWSTLLLLTRLFRAEINPRQSLFMIIGVQLIEIIKTLTGNDSDEPKITFASPDIDPPELVESTLATIHSDLQDVWEEFHVAVRKVAIGPPDVRTLNDASAELVRVNIKLLMATNAKVGGYSRS